MQDMSKTRARQYFVFLPRMRYSSVMSSITTPAWLRHAVFYQIFPDRFAQSAELSKAHNLEPWDSPPTYHGYKGGDLLGIIEKLDYLQDIGINALYLNPIFQSASNHRYHTYDYFQVDPLLGGNAAFAKFVKACKDREIRIVLDGVFNHCSRGFFQFNDILESQQASPYLDWFTVHQLPLNAYGEGDAHYDCWWGLKALPKFNTANAEVREFLWGVGTYWLEQGIDGWRLDVPNEIADDSFWQEFRRRCRAINSECYIVGEIWDDPSHWLQGDQFDAVMNYEFTRAIYGFVSANNLNDHEIGRCGYQHIPSLSASSFGTKVDALLERDLPAVQQAQFNLLGSHDTPRAITVVNGDRSAYKMALVFQFSFVGSPSIYYGDEIGMTGGHDPANRQGMHWDEGTWDRSILELIQDLIQLRRAHTALQSGSYRSLYADKGLYLYLRHDDSATFLGVINQRYTAAQLEMELDLPDGDYRSVVSSHSPNAASLNLTLKQQQSRGDSIPARTTVLLRYQG